MRLTESQMDALARQLTEGHHAEVAGALRSRKRVIIARWHRKGVELVPELARLTAAEFEDSLSPILEAVAGAMESGDPARVQRIIDTAPAHGAARFGQRVTPHALLAEERILRGVIVSELRDALERPLSPTESLTLHELLDIVTEFSLESLHALRVQERDEKILDRVAGIHRLADMGTLTSGLAHDAANLLLPIRTRLDFLALEALTREGMEDLETVTMLVGQLQDFIVNLRMLSVDPARTAHGHDDGARLSLSVWWFKVLPFYRRIMPRHITIEGDVSPVLPPVLISAASLSQVLFNLVRNAEQALKDGPRGRILVTAENGPGGVVMLRVEDDGPGMPANVLARCLEPFFTTRAGEGGTGLGLAVAHTLVVRAGGSISVESPPQGQPRGTVVIVSLPPAPSDRVDEPTPDGAAEPE